MLSTVWKLSVFGVFPVLIFPRSDSIETRKTANTENFTQCPWYRNQSNNLLCNWFITCRKWTNRNPMSTVWDVLEVINKVTGVTLKKHWSPSTMNLISHTPILWVLESKIGMKFYMHLRYRIRNKLQSNKWNCHHIFCYMCWIKCLA